MWPRMLLALEYFVTRGLELYARAYVKHLYMCISSRLCVCVCVCVRVLVCAVLDFLYACLPARAHTQNHV